MLVYMYMSVSLCVLVCACVGGGGGGGGWLGYLHICAKAHSVSLLHMKVESRKVH